MSLRSSASLFEAYEETNESFLSEVVDPQRIAAGRGSYLLRPTLIVSAPIIGVPDKTNLFEADRLTLLTERYTIPERCWAAFRDHPGATSWAFTFERTKPDAKGTPVPAAGGCLVSLVISKESSSRWHVIVTSRATEITMAWLADLLFLDSVINRILGKDVRKVKRYTWVCGVAYQTRHYPSIFMLETYGRAAVRRWMRSSARGPWEEMVLGFTQTMMGDVDDKIHKGTPRRWARYLRSKLSEK